ncbi:AAA family ATPase [Streptomyces cylindrosporus]|uniref:AAA family ATPase n=1 Tax=Streptomyces cylindrosporus TaxID=2927583 RepID=A0ABS9Y5D2_9ACTN|nr:AAA family ATPase [Streptomyces cylindrosporus]MCI3272430.1 AAA family ATPase [Streptomyces cylindrosporus]
MPPNSETPPKSAASTGSWGVYTGTGRPLPAPAVWPGPPGWRSFGGGPDLPPPPSEDPYAAIALGDGTEPLPPSPREVARVNAALYLRRPLLVTGEPGTGKSTLAHRIARELGLGRVLRWHVTSVSTLREGLYAGEGRLGPLGTAFLPHRAPRVLLIDQLDRAEIALPEDLCTVLAAGGFTVPDGVGRVATDDDPAAAVPLHGGVVRCHAFPVVVITGTGARDLPFDLVRRCVRLRLERPGPETLRAIAAARFPPGAPGSPAADVVQAFLDRAVHAEGPVVERLLDALHLSASGVLRSLADGDTFQSAVDALWEWTAPEEP